MACKGQHASCHAAAPSSMVTDTSLAVDDVQHMAFSTQSLTMAPVLACACRHLVLTLHPDALCCVSCALPCFVSCTACFWCCQHACLWCAAVSGRPVWWFSIWGKSLDCWQTSSAQCMHRGVYVDVHGTAAQPIYLSRQPTLTRVVCGHQPTDTTQHRTCVSSACHDPAVALRMLHVSAVASQHAPVLLLMPATSQQLFTLAHTCMFSYACIYVSCVRLCRQGQLEAAFLLVVELLLRALVQLHQRCVGSCAGHAWTAI